MGVASLLLVRRVPDQRIGAWILLVASLVVLALLVSAAFLGATSPGHSPASEQVMAPFRWLNNAALA